MSSPDPAPRYITIPAAAGYLSLCDRTIRRAISRGELRGFKFGKALRVRIDELDEWAEKRAMPNPNQAPATRSLCPAVASLPASR